MRIKTSIVLRDTASQLLYEPFLSSVQIPKSILESSEFEKPMSEQLTILKMYSKYIRFFLRNDVKRISVNMEALNFCVIVLEDNLNKALVCCVDDRSVQTSRLIVKRSVWKIKLVESFHVVFIRKPKGRAWIQKRNPIKRSTTCPIDFGWRHTPQDVCVCDIYLPVVI